MRRATDITAVVAVTALVFVGCSREGEVASVTPSTASSAPSTLVPTSPPTTTTTTTVPETTTTSTTTTSTTTTSTTTTSTSTTTTSTTTTTVPVTAPPTNPPTTPPVAATTVDAFALPYDTEVEIGRSVEGRPITVIRRGTPGGAKVLVVGVIHGNEADGVAVVDRLAVDPIPGDVELWLVRSMNPDGQAISDRQNANLVDLNRNFPVSWGPLGEPGFWQYGGTAPASEPETQAMVALGDSIVPDVIFWYHQDLFRLSPGKGREAEARVRYAELTGLPIIEVTGGTYTGTAAQWAQALRPDVGFSITVELGETLSADDAARHAAAVLAIGSEFF